jgi:hypothetical protein
VRGKSVGEREGREGERLSLLCSCNLDAQVVYRGACIFHCLVSPSLSSPTSALHSAVQLAEYAECIRDVPVDVCIDEKIASVPILYRGRPPPGRAFLLPSLPLFPHSFPYHSILVFPYSFFQAVPSFLRCARNANACSTASLADNPVRRTFRGVAKRMRREWGLFAYIFAMKELLITQTRVIRSICQ